MNVLKRTFVLSVKAGAQWEEIDGTNEIVSALFQKYRSIIIVLGTDLDLSERIIDLEQLRTSYALYANTLTLLVQTLDGYGFETLEELPTKKVGYVKYTSAHYARYAINYAKAGVEYPQGSSSDLLTDLSIRRDDLEGTDALQKYCLFSINGFIHNSERINGIDYVKDGGRSMQLSRSNQMGLLSFMEVGELHRVPITSSMLGVEQGFQTMADRVKITVPTGHENKPCFLVMGGYILFIDGLVFNQVSERGFTLDLELAHYIDKLLESQLYIDLSSLELFGSPINDGNLNIAQAKSDSTISKYLTLSQSFMVFVDTDKLFWNRVPLRHSNVPGLFTTYQEPEYPLFLGNGRMADYWKMEERGRWSITLADSYKRQWMHVRENEAKLVNIFNQLSFDAKNQFSTGSLMEIGSYKNGSM